MVGLTGPPGVGKSTTVAGLVTALRARDERVAVLAVDPSSPFSGGALLGDRVRMQQHALDPGVFIRSMATRGHLGGLAVAAPQTIRVLDAAGFDTVLVETVGVGQSEVDVAGQVDVTLVLLAPGMGDGIQAAKAGVLEIGDLFVVNKADRDGAHAVVRELRNMVALAQRAPEDWKPPVLTTSAVDGTGIAELLAELDRFGDTPWPPACSTDAVGTGLDARSSRWCWPGCGRRCQLTAVAAWTGSRPRWPPVGWTPTRPPIGCSGRPDRHP